MSRRGEFGSDAPPGLRAGELRQAMQELRGGLGISEPAVEVQPEDEDAGAQRSVSSSGIFRVVAPEELVVESDDLAGDPVSSAPPALRPEELKALLARCGGT